MVAQFKWRRWRADTFLLPARPSVGVSACLTGQAVRYDGGHRRSPLVAGLLAGQASLRPVCPEVETGMPVPRPPMQLIAVDTANPAMARARGVADPGMDATAALQQFGARIAERAREQGWAGHIFKSRSPSCGAGSTPVYDQAQRQLGTGDGIYARQLRAGAPWLIMVEETRLQTEADAWCFLYACRLIHELLAAPTATREEWQRHYAPLLALVRPRAGWPDHDFTAALAQALMAANPSALWRLIEPKLTD